ncbi:hypothetical protein M9434_002171 [Picochlorum sp. BPE23]|nr:hypothetical protein M9434_002171 [Picochlorum sp. BPE23]
MEQRVDLSDAYDVAISYFDSREYRSAMLVLEPLVTAHEDCPSEIKFLYYYSYYLKVQRFKAHKKAKPGMLVGNLMLAESDLTQIRTNLEKQVERLDGFLLYILGLVLIDQDHMEKAREVLVRSVELYPCNWSAWKALGTACPDQHTAGSLALPDHFMAKFFRAHVLVEFHQPEQSMEILQELDGDFPESMATIATTAMAHNHMHDYEMAQELFEKLLEKNPNIIDYMDVYSNILYVKEDSMSLMLLARRLADEDPYRPETCCVIGNYYSFRGQHDKAVIYFQRALKINQNYLPAWTLMGHEFVELKNPPAAIEAYRKAVAINPSDYRAWYGLGQTYELVNMPYYAIHYYSKAVALRPKDARMWNAIGHCYGSNAVSQIESAIRCFERALPYDKECVALRQLAYHHKTLGETNKQHYDQAAKYYQMIWEQSQEQGETPRSDATEALNFLAEYHKSSGDLHTSHEYFTKLLDFGHLEHREGAKASLRELQDMLGMGSALSPSQSPRDMVHSPGGSAPR